MIYPFVILFVTSTLVWSATSFAQPDSKRANECANRFASYEKRGFIYNLDTSRREIVIHAGPGFFAAPFDIKRGFAETVSCVAMKGDPNMLSEFSIIHWQTGKRFGRFHNGRLEVD